MSYRVQEIFATLQGEGAQAGTPAIFLRFSGCNLWSGREEDRSNATCTFCDTEFASADGEDGGVYDSPRFLAAQVATHRTTDSSPGWVVCTGGEPLLQLDEPLIEALKAEGFRVAVETNGTLPAPPGLDWICVSPKAGARWVQKSGDELKIVWPQSFDLDSLESLPFTHRYLQAQDSPQTSLREHYLRDTIRTILERPRWRLSVQVHKLIGMP
ncbi:MAG: 7-carboxy-7-deazaguanine synthase [Fibrobacteria bacterium]|nr:7-carboxy-7-deazaguanine synthase [Fibrobacteria bacterium]